MMNKKASDLTTWEVTKWIFALIAMIYAPVIAVYWIWLKWDAIKSRLEIEKKKDDKPNLSKKKEHVKLTY